MAGQEEGWPLGLQPLNVRVGLVRNRHLSGSISFNTLLTGSPTSSTVSSSDLDTESTGSFFHDKSITLGSLIGVSSILEFSRRSIRGRKTDQPLKEKKSNKSRIWFFSVCIRDDAKRSVKNPSSLGQFLAVERRAADDYRRNVQNPSINIGPDELALPQPFAEPNTLFVDGRIAPPQTSSDVKHGHGFGVPLLCSCSCMCGQPSD